MQDPLHLNIPFVPASGRPFKRPSSPLGKTFSQELPHVHLPRTHASKEEVSSLGCAELAGMDRDRQAAAHMKTVNIMIALHLTSEELSQRPKGEYCFGP